MVTAASWVAMLDAALTRRRAAVTRPGVRITHRIRTAFTVNLAIAVLITIAGVLSSPLIADLFHASSQSAVFALIFLYPLFRGAGQVNDAVLKRDLRFRRRTSVDVVRAIVRVAVSIPMALVGGAISIATDRGRGQQRWRCCGSWCRSARTPG